MTKPVTPSALNIGLGIWAAIALFTFGHSASRAQQCFVLESRPARYEPCTTGAQALSGFTAAVFWPLYWSWELQQ